jgi:ABC-type phosphate/phosphonate transport system ATPase subunit
MAAIKIQDLSYYYPETIKPALNRINLEIPEGQLLIIIGDSGSGKSTLLRVISGLIPAFYNGKLLGRVFLDGEDTVQMSRQEMVQKVGIVFQNPESQLFEQQPGFCVYRIPGQSPVFFRCFKLFLHGHVQSLFNIHDFSSFSDWYTSPSITISQVGNWRPAVARRSATPNTVADTGWR